MSSVFDQVEVEVARAKRDFARSRNIIAAARDDLESHQRWMDDHRTAVAEAAKRHQSKRLAVGLTLLQPLACTALFCRTIQILPFLWELISIRFRINAKDAHDDLTHPRKPLCPSLNTWRIVMMLRSQERQLSVWSLGVVVIVLVAAGAVPATIPERSAETSLAEISKIPGLKQATVSDAPRKIRRLALSPRKAAGLRVPAATSVPEQLSMPPETVAAMMRMASPVTFEPPARVAVAASAEGGVPASKADAKAKPKRRTVTQEPQSLPWLRQRHVDHRASPGAQRESRKLPWFRQLPWIEIR